MELRCRNLHIVDIGKKEEENNGRKASSDLERSLKGDCKTPRLFVMSCPPPQKKLKNN